MVSTLRFRQTPPQGHRRPSEPCTALQELSSGSGSGANGSSHRQRTGPEHTGAGKRQGQACRAVQAHLNRSPGTPRRRTRGSERLALDAAPTPPAASQRAVSASPAPMAPGRRVLRLQARSGAAKRLATRPSGSASHRAEHRAKGREERVEKAPAKVARRRRLAGGDVGGDDWHRLRRLRRRGGAVGLRAAAVQGRSNDGIVRPGEGFRIMDHGLQGGSGARVTPSALATGLAGRERSLPEGLTKILKAGSSLLVRR